MGVISGPYTLAATGQTGNNTHTGIDIGPYASGRVCVNFIVEAIGATPTVTFKLQGAMNDTTLAYADIATVDSNADTIVTTKTVTAVGQFPVFVNSGPVDRFYRFYRLVTSANTNVTYRAELWAVPEAL